MNMASNNGDSSRRREAKSAHVRRIVTAERTRAHAKQVSKILKKSAENRTVEDCQLLTNSDDIIAAIKKRAKIKEQIRQRHEEIEDGRSLCEEKCKLLATAIKHAKSLVVYTGAGISTAASIPDYRGPNGVWTLLRQGKSLCTTEISQACPTYTHMCIAEMYSQGLLCKNCRPPKSYVRLFDVTERTSIRRHKTGRFCHDCKSELSDTIVHFGEKGGVHAPYNWQQAADAANSADVILCLGSSLKVLRKYACLWSMHKPASRRPLLYIVNLQWTPKDDGSALKINGKCDDVMQLIAKELNLDVSRYTLDVDPLFALATSLTRDELSTTSKQMLVRPETYNESCVRWRLQNCNTSKLCKPYKRRRVARTNLVRVGQGKQSVIMKTQTPAKLMRNGENVRKLSPAAPLSAKSDSLCTVGCKMSPVVTLQDLTTTDPSNKKYSHLQSQALSEGSFGTSQHSNESVGSDQPGQSSGLSAAERLPVSPFMQLARNVRDTTSPWWNSVHSEAWLAALEQYLLTHVNRPIKPANQLVHTSPLDNHNHFAISTSCNAHDSINMHATPSTNGLDVKITSAERINSGVSRVSRHDVLQLSATDLGYFRSSYETQCFYKKPSSTGFHQSQVGVLACNLAITPSRCSFVGRLEPVASMQSSQIKSGNSTTPLKHSSVSTQICINEACKHSPAVLNHESKLNQMHCYSSSQSSSVEHKGDQAAADNNKIQKCDKKKIDIGVFKVTEHSASNTHLVDKDEKNRKKVEEMDVVNLKTNEVLNGSIDYKHKRGHNLREGIQYCDESVDSAPQPGDSFGKDTMSLRPHYSNTLDFNLRSTSCSQPDSKVPTMTSSLPGWFGKGLCVRKLKRRRSKLKSVTK